MPVSPSFRTAGYDQLANIAIPVGRILPPIYAKMARAILWSHQDIPILHPNSYRDILLGPVAHNDRRPFTDADLPTRRPHTVYLSSSEPGAKGKRGKRVPVHFNYASPHLVPGTHAVKPVRCLGCGSTGFAPLRSVVSRHAYCSRSCGLALILFVQDMATLYRSPYVVLPPSAKVFRYLVPHHHMYPRGNDKTFRIVESRSTSFSPFVLAGDVSRRFALNVCGFAVPHPRHLVEHVRRLVLTHDSKADVGGPPAPLKEEEAKHHGALPAPHMTIGALDNPITQKAAQVVLAHLDTANDVLKPTRAGAVREAVWSKDQTSLFLALLRHTVPTLSASVNITRSVSPSDRDPDEMTQEEIINTAKAIKNRNKREDAPK